MLSNWFQHFTCTHHPTSDEPIRSPFNDIIKIWLCLTNHHVGWTPMCEWYSYLARSIACAPSKLKLVSVIVGHPKYLLLGWSAPNILNMYLRPLVLQGNILWGSLDMLDWPSERNMHTYENRTTWVIIRLKHHKYSAGTSQPWRSSSFCSPSVKMSKLAPQSNFQHI